MRQKLTVLCSASVLVLAFAGHAFAQSTTSPGAATAAPDSAPADVEEVVVTGLRQSLQSAQTLKRVAPQQVDAIVAEDIGKLPDVAVSDTAARIVGVQVERGGGEASRVLVRGLPDFATTYNGREIFTAEARSVALQDFPSGAIGAVEVFKNTTADLVEAGLAGEVNVRSHKPFDFDGLEIAGSVWGQYESRSEHYDPNGNLLISDRWDTGAGEIGALVNFSYTRLRYLDSTRSNTDFVAQSNIGAGGATVRFPDIQRVTYGVGDRQRPSVNAAVQWRPSEGLEFYAEGLWQGFRNKVSDHEISVPLWNPGNALYSNIVFEPTTNMVRSLTVANPFRPDGFQGATKATTNTYQYAVGGKYDAGPLHVSGDLAHTRSKFLDSIYSFDTAFAATQTINADFGLTGTSRGPAFQFATPVDLSNPATFIYRGFFDRQLIATGKDWQARLDGAYDLDAWHMTRMEVGVRYVDRDAHFEDGSRYNYREPERLPLSAIPVSYAVSPTGFPEGDTVAIRGYYTPTYGSIRSNIAQLRTFSGFAQGAPPPDPSVTYSANEKSWAAYAQIKYAIGEAVDGAIGIRAVKTELHIEGTDRVRGAGGTPDTFVPRVNDKSYTDWLPNVSARLHFSDKLQLRLSYTETRTRPNFAQYNPGIAVDPSSAGGALRVATGGNPDLNPLKSKNYDASFEYYFSPTGSASFAVFRRDLNGFIQNFNEAIVDPTYGAILINRPFNTGSGRIDGFEAQVTTFLELEALPTWTHGFGFQWNITYLDAETGFPPALGGTITRSPIIGVSKWTYNLAAFYENDALSARLSYNHRGDYPSRFEARGADTYAEETKGIGRLDLSMSYNLTKRLTLMADATNILGKPYKSDLTYGFSGGADPVTFPRAVRYEESVYSLGLRFRF